MKQVIIKTIISIAIVAVSLTILGVVAYLAFGLIIAFW